MELSNLRPAEGSKHSDNFRRGRGHGSGNGKTAGKGHKGQNARSGGGVRLGFEGGQTPLARRLPKRGFTNFTRKEYAIVNVASLNRFEDGTDGITGIAHEPWHLRYVGEDVAKEIQKNGWTFEEYCLYNNVMPEVKEQ